MKKIYVPIAIGILALVILIVNYAVMQPISQQQYRDLEQMLPAYGLMNIQVTPENLDKIVSEAWAYGLEFNYEWYNLYEAYIMTQNEILLVSTVCMGIAIICFGIAVYLILRKMLF